ncbi:hypothetical protein LTR17_022246 [Elasticomyces elasticus]|nr:hypothetical protein LTR17_022246 [Elasticomyces elasticus]
MSLKGSAKLPQLLRTASAPKALAANVTGIGNRHPLPQRQHQPVTRPPPRDPAPRPPYLPAFPSSDPSMPPATPEKQELKKSRIPLQGLSVNVQHHPEHNTPYPSDHTQQASQNITTTNKVSTQHAEEVGASSKVIGGVRLEEDTIRFTFPSMLQLGFTVADCIILRPKGIDDRARWLRSTVSVTCKVGRLIGRNASIGLQRANPEEWGVNVADIRSRVTRWKSEAIGDGVSPPGNHYALQVTKRARTTPQPTPVKSDSPKTSLTDQRLLESIVSDPVSTAADRPRTTRSTRSKGKQPKKAKPRRKASPLPSSTDEPGLEWSGGATPEDTNLDSPYKSLPADPLAYSRDQERKEKLLRDTRCGITIP